MARKKKTDTVEIKTTKKETNKKVIKHTIHNKGEIILVPYAERPGDVLGAVYDFNDVKVRLVYIGIPLCKLEVL